MSLPVTKPSIRSILQASDRPLTAKDIAKRLGCTKKDVNQLIYKIDGVEQKPGTSPPQWLLAVKDTEERLVKGGDDFEKDSTKLPTIGTDSSLGSGLDQKGASPHGATPVSVGLGDQRSSSSLSSTDSSADSPTSVRSDSELGHEITRILYAASSPLSAPEISRMLQPPPKHTADVKRVLGQMEKKGDVENTLPTGQKPLWRMKKASVANGQAKVDGKPLYSLERSCKGELTFIPVDGQELVNTASRDLTPKLSEESLPQSRQPTLECADSVATVPTDTSGKEVKAPEQGSDEKKTPVVASKRAPIKLAANFENPAPNFENSELKQQILGLLESSPSQWYTCDDVRQELRLKTRDIPLICLRNLEKEGVVVSEQGSSDGTKRTRKFRFKSG